MLPLFLVRESGDARRPRPERDRRDLRQEPVHDARLLESAETHEGVLRFGRFRSDRRPRLLR